jgi:uncharacterized membrane protein YkvA (DUF1232 family)
MVGFTDDLAALVLAATRVMRNITTEIKEKALQKLNKWWSDDKKDTTRKEE